MGKEDQVQIVNEWDYEKNFLIVGCKYKDIELIKRLLLVDLVNEQTDSNDESALTKTAIRETLTDLLVNYELPERQQVIVKKFIKNTLNT